MVYRTYTYSSSEGVNEFDYWILDDIMEVSLSCSSSCLYVMSIEIAMYICSCKVYIALIIFKAYELQLAELD